MKPEPTRSTTPPALASKTDTKSPDAISAELLFCGEKEIVIHHQREDYRLRITRNNKLILTK
jgi:hemin uptake protein HemP